MRKKNNRDANEKVIIETIKSCRCRVHRMSSETEPGMPDLLVGRNGTTVMIEVKNPDSQPASANDTIGKKATGPGGKWEGMDPDLRETQAIFIKNWTGGPVHVVRTEEDVFRVLGYCKKCKVDLTPYITSRIIGNDVAKCPPCRHAEHYGPKT